MTRVKIVDPLWNLCYELWLFSIFEGCRWYISLVSIWVGSIKCMIVVVDYFFFELNGHIILLSLRMMKTIIELFTITA